MNIQDITTILADNELGKLAEHAFTKNHQYKIRYKGKAMARLVSEKLMMAFDRFITYEKKLEKEAEKALKNYRSGKQKAYTNARDLISSL